MLNNKAENIGFESTLNQKKNLSGFRSDTRIGSFVFFSKREGEKLFFRDFHDKIHSLKKCLFIKDAWNNSEGEKSLPLPFLLDNDGVTLEDGELVAYCLSEGSDNIIIFGAVGSYSYERFDTELNFDLSDFEDLKIKNKIYDNVKRNFSVLDDGKGNLTIYLKGKEVPESEESNSDEEETPGTGNLNIKVVGTKDNGNVHLQLNGKFAITQMQKESEEDAEEKPIAQILFDNTLDAEKISIIDKYKNQILFDREKVLLKDRFGNKIETAEKSISITDSNNNQILLNDKGAELVVKGDATAKVEGDLTVESSKSATVKAPEVVITGGKLKVDGACAPNGKGGFLATKNCIWSGAPISSNKIVGT